MADALSQARPPAAAFCPRCFDRLATGQTACQRCDGGPAPDAEATKVQHLTDRITDTIGVDRIEGFSAKSFFADLFKRRTPEEVDAHFAYGFPGNVPEPIMLEAEWPRPWSFLRVLGAGGLLFGLLLVAYDSFANPNLIPGLIMTGSFAAPVAMLVFFYEMTIPRNISVYHLARLFLLGGVAAIFLALVIGTVFPLDSVIGAPAAGVTEELAKLAIVIAALRMMRLGRRPCLLNGMLIGATVGAGFAALESAGYAFRVLLDALPGVTVVDVILLRGVLSPFSHVAWTALAAGALWRVSAANRFSLDIVRDPRFLKLFGLAVALHALWDTALPFPVVKYAVLSIVAVVAVLSLLQSGVRQIGEIQAGAVSGSQPGSSLVVASA